MDEELIIKIKSALRKSWSKDTSYLFNEGHPYYGQCAQTAIIICEKFGGEILKTSGWPARGNSVHFYNRINGKRYDFTAEQFSDIPNYTHKIEYEDAESSCKDATDAAYEFQISALRTAFERAFSESCV